MEVTVLSNYLQLVHLNVMMDIIFPNLKIIVFLLLTVPQQNTIIQPRVNASHVFQPFQIVSPVRTILHVYLVLTQS